MSGGTHVPKGYQPTGQAQADQMFQGITGSQYNIAKDLPGQVLPQMYSQAQGIANNPYAASTQAGINQAGSIATGQVAPMDFANAASLSSFAGQAQPLAQQIIGQAFDPQSALYNRQYQQTIDQSNAINAMYGLGNSPYGAGLTQQAGNNFNIDWQNQQLQRMLGGANAYGGLLSGAQGAYGAAGDLANAGLGVYTTGTQLPYQQYANNLMGGMEALGGYSSAVGNALQPGAGLTSELSNYLSLGQNATKNAQNAAALQNQIDSQSLGGFGSLLGGAFNMASNPLSLFGTAIW